MFSALARRAEEDAPATGRSLDALKTEAASVLTEVMDAVAGPGPRLYFHQRLGRGWKVLERDNPLIRRVLVLAADETIDPAVVATRAAAGGGASPAAAAFAGLAVVLASPLYAAVARATVFVQEARREPSAAIARRIARDGGLPGFAGDDGWPSSDPRADALLMAADLPADLSAVLQQGEAITGNPPGFDLALALVARRLDLPRDGACDLLLISRLIGLLGHALDQAGDGSPIATRLRYVGPRPGAG
jgi:citrate synthase